MENENEYFSWRCCALTLGPYAPARQEGGRVPVMKKYDVLYSIVSSDKVGSLSQNSNINNKKRHSWDATMPCLKFRLQKLLVSRIQKFNFFRLYFLLFEYLYRFS